MNASNFSLSQGFTKTTASGRHGIVAAQHRQAAEIGARVLEQGGDCIDAAVATSFAIGVLEPWMSGIGGIGTMVVYRAREERCEVIDFGGMSPAGLDPADYPLSGAGVASDLFPWPQVVGDRNLQGATAVAVPGVVAGMGEAHRRHGRMDWLDLVLPSVALAHEGPLVDWFTTVNIASAAAALRQDPTAAAEFLRDGMPPSAPWGVRSQVRLPRPRYAATLEHIAREGARSFYEGDLAQTIAREMRAAGGPLSAGDLAGYQVRVGEALAIPYRQATVYATPELTAGPTLAQTLHLLGGWQPQARPDADTYATCARALQEAYRQRLHDMGDADGRRAVGAEHLPPSCTTHFNVIDGEGNMVAVTQTLLGIFGARFVTPETGILMNNGIMWFDPTPGHTNSLSGDKRCLSNYTPVVARLGGGGRLALGASGGRRILPAVAQLLSWVIDYGMDLQQAFDTPRIDASEGDIVIGDTRLDAQIQARLRSDFDFAPTPVQTLPMKFACPSAVMQRGGTQQGATELFNPWADAVAARARA